MQVTRSFYPHWLPHWSVTALWNRGLPAQVRITHTILWPLLLVPLLLFNQLVTPHPVWVVLLVTLVGLYALGILWVRDQAQRVTLTRRRTGVLLVAGDELSEEFELRNDSTLPVLWAEFLDQSDLPDYHPGRVVGCGGNASYRWNAKMTCRRRGVYRLGPHQLVLGDPFHLFTLTIDFPESETVLIYPRVLHLPPVQLPLGSTTGTARRQRPLFGAQPATTVRDYQPTDSLRYVHWPITAHRGQLTVKELETEPSGAVWLVLDLDQGVHQGEGDLGTLEYSIIVAASLTAQLVNSSDQRAVGLFTIGGEQGDPQAGDNRAAAQGLEVITRQPQSGQAQLWAILAALAPVQPGRTPLVELLRTARASLGRRSTIVVVTARPTALLPEGDWPAQLVHLQATGVTSTVCLVSIDPRGRDQEEPVRTLLARYNIPVQTFVTSAQLPAALTFRRTRKVVRSTPTGGVVTYEEEVEVG
ncbi:MAG: DUF58 domain-containing protein [Caldilinea sp. CFX5]|nr:DUF58 domain-containing protein [Caldilinea sp. CFX5]